MMIANGIIWRTFLSQDPLAEVIDVLKPEEGNKPFVDRAIELDVEDKNNFLTSIKKLDPKKHYYIFSRTGKRGELACEIREEHGFKETINLSGGIIGFLD